LRQLQWGPRLKLWQQTHAHWIDWERLMEQIPEPQARQAGLLGQSVRDLERQLQDSPQSTTRRDIRSWQELAQRQQLPVLLLLALAETLRPLHACLGGLNRLAPP
jgi:hypothetical protein